MRLVIMAAMAALAAVMAVPVFAAQPDDTGPRGPTGCDEFGVCGGTGGMSQSSGDGECDPTIQKCSGTSTASGGGGGGFPGEGGGGGGGEHITATMTQDFTDPSDPVLTDSGSVQGGSSGTQGGNCTYEYSLDTGYTVDGNGPRCDQLFEYLNSNN